MVFLEILLYVFLAIGMIIAVFIFIPYEYSASGKKMNECRLNAAVSWMFGGVSIALSRDFTQNVQVVNIKILGVERKINLRESIANRPEEMEKSKPRDKSAFTKHLNIDIMKEILAACIRIMDSCKPRRVYVNARIGFDDPLGTGMLCAVLGLMYRYLNRFEIKVIPIFDEEIIEGKFLIRGRIWLPCLILVTAGLLVAEPFRKIYISWLKTKIKGGLQYAKQF